MTHRKLVVYAMAMLLVAFVTTFNYGGCGGGGSGGGSSGSSAYWDITIYVKDAGTEESLRGISVLITAYYDNYGGTTDSAGKVRFQSVAHSNHKVSLWVQVDGETADNGHQYFTWSSYEKGYPDGIDFTGKSIFTVSMTRIPGT